MSSLTSSEKLILENILSMGGGYVLDFSNPTFADFFSNVNIDDEKYCVNGTSKANRLRAFWSIEDDRLVGFTLNQLLERWQTVKDISGEVTTVLEYNLYVRGQEIAKRLLNGKANIVPGDESDSELEDVGNLNFDKLEIEQNLLNIIRQRTVEIKKCLKAEAPLAVIFLCGSTLEGLLLDHAIKNGLKYSQAQSAPRDSYGKIINLEKWSLSNLITVGCEIANLGEDVKKFSDSLRDFRNYIHPNAQARSGFNPDIHTADICFRVLKLAIIRLSSK